MTITYGEVTFAVLQILIAIYKLVWNRFVIPRMIMFMGQYTLTQLNENKLILFQYVMEIFNNIVAPCLATAVISRDCLYNVFINPPSVDASYNYNTCDGIYILNGTCSTYITETQDTSYIPPFNYSYQCSSVLITTYAAVYVYLFIFIAFGKPLLMLLLEYVHNHTSRAVIKHLVFELLPVINRSRGLENPTKHEAIFEKSRFILSLLMHFTVLMTFGVVFPPLCFICFSLWSHTIYTERTIGRFLMLSEHNHYGHLMATILNSNAAHLFGILQVAVISVVFFAAVFYALFIFDTVGEYTRW